MVLKRQAHSNGVSGQTSSKSAGLSERETAGPETASSNVRNRSATPTQHNQPVSLPPRLLAASDLLHLQRSLGNRAVYRLLAGSTLQRSGGRPQQSHQQPPQQTALVPQSAPEAAPFVTLLQGKKEKGQTSLMIQRKVGFEFETGVPVKTTPGAKKIPYGVQIYDSGDQSWQIKSDNSKVEFVTKEVDDTLAGKEKVAATMNQVTSWAKGMAALTGTARPPRTGKLSDVQPSYGQAKQYNTEDIVLDSGPLSPTDVVAAPQATGGVTLDKIPALIDQMIAVKLNHLRYSETFQPQFEPPEAPDYSKMTEEEAELAGLQYEGDQWMHENITEPMTKSLEKQGHNTTDISYSAGVESLMTIAYLTSAKSAVHNFILSEIESKIDQEAIEFQQELGIAPQDFRAQTPNLQGLLTLVISYLLGGDASNHPAPYTKSIATLMSRTNIYELHKLLTEAERKIFEPETVLYIAGLSDGPLFKGGFKTSNGDKPGPKRSEWITSIIQGTKLENSEDVVPFDRLSQKSQTPEAHNSSSLGAIDKPDENIRTLEENLAVLEIRSMPKNQTIDDWPQTAFTVFDMFMRLNMTASEKSFFDGYAQLKRYHREVMIGKGKGLEDIQYRRQHLEMAAILIGQLETFAEDSVDAEKMLALVNIYKVGLFRNGREGAHI